MYYPVQLNLKGRTCLVVGGGEVAYRKVRALLSFGAKVKLVSPEIVPDFNNLKKNERFKYIKKRYSLKDLKNVFLAVVATDNMELNATISAAAKSRKVLVNVVDVPGLCDFILPAIAKRGDLTITVSTNGVSPSLAKYLRKDIEKRYGGYAGLLKPLKEMRSKIIKLDKKKKEKVWNSIINEAFLKKNRKLSGPQIENAVLEKLKEQGLS